MTTIDTDTLTERIRRARSLPAEWARLREGESTREQIERHQRRMDEQTAALVAEEVRKAKAEAFDSFCNALADHLDLGTPRAWGFRHPCDPPGVRWEPTERDRALMDVADLVRNDTLNPYRESGDSDEHR